MRNRHDLRWQRHKSACRYGVPHVYSAFVVVDRTVRCMNDDGFRTISRVRIQSSGRLGVYVHQLLPVWREQPLVIRAPCISVFGLLSRRRCFKTRPSLRGTWRDEQERSGSNSKLVGALGGCSPSLLWTTLRRGVRGRSEVRSFPITCINSSIGVRATARWTATLLLALNLGDRSASGDARPNFHRGCWPMLEQPQTLRSSYRYGCPKLLRGRGPVTQCAFIPCEG